MAPLLFSCVAVAVQISDFPCFFYIFGCVAVAVTSQFGRKSFVPDDEEVQCPPTGDRISFDSSPYRT